MADELRGDDATRRTHLANERTYLAWWRSGLTAFGVALAAGKLIPELSSESHARWPYEALGVAFAILGALFVGYGFVRLREVDRAVRRRDYAHPDERFLLGLAAAGVALGIATAVILLAY
jgi:putative membrane protein